jgi:hypothetical protein
MHEGFRTWRNHTQRKNVLTFTGDATEASLNGGRREDRADIPSEFVQNSHDDVLARILKQNHSPLLFFTVFPRVYIQMRRKAREAKERVRTGQTPPTSPGVQRCG